MLSGAKFCLDAEDKCNVLARDVAAAQAERNRNFDSVEGAHNRVLEQAVLLAGPSAVKHFAEDDSAHTIEFSSMAKLPEHAVDLVRLCSDVFDEEQFPLGCGLPGCAEERKPSGEATE